MWPEAMSSLDRPCCALIPSKKANMMVNHENPIKKSRLKRERNSNGFYRRAHHLEADSSLAHHHRPLIGQITPSVATNLNKTLICNTLGTKLKCLKSFKSKSVEQLNGLWPIRPSRLIDKYLGLCS